MLLVGACVLTSVLTACRLLPSPPGYFEVHLWMLVSTHVLDVGLLGAHQEPSGSEFSTAFEGACCHMLFWRQKGG